MKSARESSELVFVVLNLVALTCGFNITDVEIVTKFAQRFDVSMSTYI